MRVPDLPWKEVADVARAFRKTPVVALNAYREEAVSLVKSGPNLFADISFVDGFEALPGLMRRVPAGRVLFGSHTPFLYTRSAILKLERASLSRADRERIASGNLRALLKFRTLSS